MNFYIDYIHSVAGNVMGGVKLGTFVYIIIFFTLMAAMPSRRNLKLKYLAEWLFCIYTGALLNRTGMLGLGLAAFRLTGLRYNLMPIVDGVLHPMVLNFILFVPFGFLLPLALYRRRGGGRGKSATKHGWRWYHALIFGMMFSLIIEIIQLFFGRLAEVDDVIMNGLGTLAGYAFCASILQIPKRPLRALSWLAILVAAVILGYCGLCYILTGTITF